MKHINLHSYKEQYKTNKKQMIKEKKGRIVSLELLEKIRNQDEIIDIDVSISFLPEISLQKVVLKEGFLLPYKFSKKIEKAKFVFFLLRKHNRISEEGLMNSLYELNQLINEEISIILQMHTKNNWGVSEIKMSKIKD